MIDTLLLFVLWAMGWYLLSQSRILQQKPILVAGCYVMALAPFIGLLIGFSEPL